MNKDSLTRFLNGTATEAEQRTYETLLGSAESIVDDSLLDHDDPMIRALQQPIESAGATGSLERLPQQIQQMFPENVDRLHRMRQALPASEHPEDLGAIGKYRLIELIGIGSSSWVFRALDSKLEREVCIKLLQPDRGSSWEVQSRFAREAREVARMNSDRIMPVLELGYLDQNPYLVMPLLEGRLLRTLLTQEQQIPVERVVQFAKQIAEGLAHAHSLGVMHRDIKPENIWVTPNGNVKLLDFGLAHVRDEATPITREGTVVGTPSYMSPEQVTGRPIDARSDLFSLGIVIVEMLTGQSPFHKKNLFSTMMSVAGDAIDFSVIDPESLIPKSLRAVIVDLLHKNPDERIGSAEKLIERLDSLRSPRQKEGGRRLGGIARMLGAGVAGFAFCALLFAFWMLSDKGTLVVKAVDPNTQVIIANEKVTVIDTFSQKRYEIKIGETKLPSGHYQLESEPAEGIVFSSDEITIRRGERVLVVVNLKPSEKKSQNGQSVAVTESANGPAESSKNPDDRSLLSPESSQTWADATRDPLAHDPATRKQVFDRLNALPSLPFKRSVPDSDPQLADVKDWWVSAPAMLNSVDGIPNCDQTMWLENQMEWVKIANRSGDKQLHIPTEGLFLDTGRSIARWDAVNPNLLVIMSSNKPDPSKGKQPLFKAQVWLLSELEDCIQGRLIREYLCDSVNVLLDSGYRIILVRDQQLEIQRLDNDQAWVLAKIEPEKISRLFYVAPTSISPDGRWLAATVSSLAEKSIFDLQTGRMELAVKTGRIVLGNGGRGVAIQRESLIDGPVQSSGPLGAGARALTISRDSVKLWDIARKTMEKAISLDGLSSPQLTPIAVNPSSTYLAYPTESNITIVELQSGKQISWRPTWSRTVADTSVNPSSRKVNGSVLRVNWQDDGTLLAFHRGETATWKLGIEENQATQVLIPNHNPLIGCMEIVGLQMHDDRELSIAWQASSGYQNRVSAARLSLPQSKIINAKKLDGAYCVDQQQKARRPSLEKIFSPDGRYIVANKVLSKFVVDLAQPDVVVAEIDNLLQKLSWSKDSKYAWMGRQVFDLEHRKLFEVQADLNAAIPLIENSVISIHPGEILFHNSLETGGGKSIDDKLAKAVGFRHRRIVLANGGEAGPLLLLENQDNGQPFSITLVRVHEDLTFEVIGSGPFRISTQELVSPNASHLLRAPHPPNLNWEIQRIHARDEKKLVIEKVCYLQKDVTAFQWHPQNTSACWSRWNDRYLGFFDCTTNTVHETKLRSDLVIPFYSGWLVAVDDRLIAVDKTGKPNAEMLFSWDDENLKGAHWVLPNGTVHVASDTESPSEVLLTWIDQGSVRTLPLKRAIEVKQIAPWENKVISTEPLMFLE